MMQAVVNVRGLSPGMLHLRDHYPAEMLPVLDRPFLQHVLDRISACGVHQVHLVLDYFPDQIETFVGNGERWGLHVTYHLAREPYHPYRFLKSLAGAQPVPEAILLVHADRLLTAPIAPAPAGAPAGPPLVWCWRKDADTTAAAWQWSGWAIVTLPMLAGLRADMNYEQCESEIMAWVRDGRATLLATPQPLSLLSYGEYLESQRRVLAKEVSGLVTSAWEADPGIWLSRNVMLHPKATIVAPVFIGENCRIESGAQIGPNVTIGHNCMLDQRSTASQSVILPGSYVGEGLEVNHLIIDRNRLISVQAGTAITVTDDFILASMQENPIHRSLMLWTSQIFGAILLLALLPLLVLMVLWLRVTRRGPVLWRRDVVKLPASLSEPGLWQTYRLWSFDVPTTAPLRTVPRRRQGWRNFFLCFLPGLVNVAKGDLRFVGMPPRSAAELDLLSHDWRAVYLASKAGLVDEGFVQFGVDCPEEEQYSAEAFYAANAGFKYDLKLLRGYVAALFR